MEKKKPNLMPLITLGALIVGGGLVYFAFGQMGEAAERLEGLRAQNVSEEDAATKLAASMEDLQQYRTELDHLEQGVPELAYMPTMLADLEQVGIANGITVTGVRPEQKKAPAAAKGKETAAPAKKAYEEIDITVTGRGGFEEVMSLLMALEQFPKIVAVTSVGLDPITEANSPDMGKLNATVKLRAYVFAPAPGSKIELPVEEVAEPARPRPGDRHEEVTS